MRLHFSRIFLWVTAPVMVFISVGCAYKLSSRSSVLPGSVRLIQIPLFKNESNEVGAETFFTNALKYEALKSKIVTLKNDSSEAEAILQGTIRDITVVADESVIEAKNTTYLPTENVLATQYKVTATVILELKRRKNAEILYSGQFAQTINYSAPQITLPIINTANSLYNESAKRQTLDAISKELMQAAFDRMIEDF